MNKELEKYLVRKMVIDKYAEPTYQKANEIYLEKIGYSKMGWWKKFRIDLQSSKFGSDIFNKIKDIQGKLIQELVEEYTTHNIVKGKSQ